MPDPAPAPAIPRRIHELPAPWVRSRPAHPALRDAHGALDYAGLEQASLAAAAQLQQWGVRGGDRLLVVGENCVAIGVLALACSRLDAWLCVVNARLSAREIDAIIAHAGPRRVLYTTQVSTDAVAHAERRGAQPVALGGAAALHLGALDEDAVAEACHAAAEQQVAALIYTSGTSGAPKGVMLTHANLAFAAAAVPAVRGLGPHDRVYGALPMAHVVGLSAQLLGSLASGAELVLEPRFSPALLAQALEGGVTSFTGVPAMYARLLEWLREQRRELHAPRLRLIGVAGSPLTPTLKAEAEQVFGLPLLNGYGLTETAPTIAQVRAGAPRGDCAVGAPIPGVQTRLVDADGAEAAPGEVGELHVRGPNVMKGYYRDDALTRQVIDAEGWFNTGDMARRGGDGALHIVGRSKELIIRSGFNVYPVEVEQVINSFPGVRQSAVVGRTVGHNEEVVAYVEPAAGAQIDEQALRRHLRERLSAYKQPAQIHFMAQLPAAPTGKLLKGVLKTLAQQGHEPGA
ncbi:MAG TPA: AMP-binding protein [Rubrivivax sp.]|nr:AMP-binding protein [Rubrivivax sp.]